jgi:hypothetical protein
MRTDDAFDLVAPPLALVFFSHSMTEFGELATVFFCDPVLPAPHGPDLGLGNPIAAAKKANVRETSGYHSVQASLAELVFAAPLLENTAPPLLRARNRR